MATHPWVFKTDYLSTFAEHHLGTGQDMQINEGWKSELGDVKRPLHLLDLEYCPGLAIVLQDVRDLGIHFEESTVVRDLEAGIVVALKLHKVWESNWSEPDKNL